MEIKILITGDYCPIGRTDKYLKEKKYNELLNGFNKIIESVDYAIVNFECPVTKSKTKIEKTGPCLKTENLNSFEALKFAGFDLLTLANNHILDYSGEGVLDTIKYAKDKGFDVVGAGLNIKEASEPFIKEIKGVRIGFVNIAENEFCAAEISMPGAYTFDFIDNTKVIGDLRIKVDKIVLIYHGGREHYQLPTPEQRKRFRYFIDCGVDAIVAHHTHCVSGYEYYEGKPIVYSVGNFIFDYKKKYQNGIWTEGMSVILELEDINSNFIISLLPHTQGREDDCTLKLMQDNQKVNFLNMIKGLSDTITNDDLFQKAWHNYILTQERSYLPSLYIRNIYMRAFFMLGILPISFLRSKHNKLILNLVRCESHREILTKVLKVKIK
jgi:poly-gamma-glutamate capsule biosynthesis protein CapA/YwtB (metallophosphatase superfamily)